MKGLFFRDLQALHLKATIIMIIIIVMIILAKFLHRLTSNEGSVSNVMTKKHSY